jgi:hypothetical protein
MLAGINHNYRQQAYFRNSLPPPSGDDEFSENSIPPDDQSHSFHPENISPEDAKRNRVELLALKAKQPVLEIQARAALDNVNHVLAVLNLESFLNNGELD